MDRIRALEQENQRLKTLEDENRKAGTESAASPAQPLVFLNKRLSNSASRRSSTRTAKQVVLPPLMSSWIRKTLKSL
eukprot:1192292-Prorocentrum_minimum.AAC.1